MSVLYRLFLLFCAKIMCSLCMRQSLLSFTSLHTRDGWDRGYVHMRGRVNGVGSDYYRSITKRFDRRTIGVDARACVSRPNTPETAYTRKYFDTVTVRGPYHVCIEIHLNRYRNVWHQLKDKQFQFRWYVSYVAAFWDCIVCNTGLDVKCQAVLTDLMTNEWRWSLV